MSHATDAGVLHKRKLAWGREALRGAKDVACAVESVFANGVLNERKLAQLEEALRSVKNVPHAARDLAVEDMSLECTGAQKEAMRSTEGVHDEQDLIVNGVLNERRFAQIMEAVHRRS